MQLTEHWPLGPAQSLVHSRSLSCARLYSLYSVSAPAGGVVRSLGAQLVPAGLSLRALRAVKREVLEKPLFI